MTIKIKNKKLEKETRALFIIFGGSGDLARRKLYPALFRMFLNGNLQEHFAVIGTSRRSWPDDYYESIVLDSIKNVSGATEEDRQNFIKHFFYQSNDVTEVEQFSVLKDKANRIKKQFQIDGPWIYYLAMAPALFGKIACNLAKSDFLSNEHPNRVVIEKPFGHDLASAQRLNGEIKQAFLEKDIYRIDHYLGKEIVENIIPLRFANPVIKAIWNHKMISNIQITLAEEVGVEQRAEYYEQAGALRDMFQNHISQLIALLTMEDPMSLELEDFIAEKKCVFDNIQKITPDDLKLNFVRGQYSQGNNFVGYREEKGVDPNSIIETFVAGKIVVDNGILGGVPIYFRTGKRLKQKVTRVDVVFKSLKEGIYASSLKYQNANVFSILIDPEAGFSFSLNGKTVGDDNTISKSSVDKIYSVAEHQKMPEAYQRLFHDVLKGDRANFVQWVEVEASWKLTDQIINYWKNVPVSDDFFYPAGSMGPKSSEKLLTRDHNFWIY